MFNKQALAKTQQSFQHYFISDFFLNVKPKDYIFSLMFA